MTIDLSTAVGPLAARLRREDRRGGQPARAQILPRQRHGAMVAGRGDEELLRVGRDAHRQAVRVPSRVQQAPVIEALDVDVVGRAAAAVVPGDEGAMLPVGGDLRGELPVAREADRNAVRDQSDVRGRQMLGEDVIGGPGAVILPGDERAARAVTGHHRVIL